jgi:hypothetical protein
MMTLHGLRNFITTPSTPAKTPSRTRIRVSTVMRGMGPQGQRACRSITNLGQFFIAYHVPFSIAQHVKHVGRGDDRDSALGRNAAKHTP